MAEPTPDQVAAYLAEVRERAAATKTSAHGYTPRGETLPSGPCGEWVIANLASATDVPRLFAAVEAVLTQHQPGRVLITGALCPRHENHRHFSITGTEATSVRDCPDCAAAVWTSCAGCPPQMPLESCPARTAISAALLAGEPGA